MTYGRETNLKIQLVPFCLALRGEIASGVAVVASLGRPGRSLQIPGPQRPTVGGPSGPGERATKTRRVDVMGAAKLVRFGQSGLSAALTSDDLRLLTIVSSVRSTIL